MAITVDASSTTNAGGASATVAWAHTCSGADRFLLVSVATNGGGTDTTGVRYNSVSLTQIGVRQEGPTGYRISLWGLINPTSGSHNISADFTAGQAIECVGASFNGVHQTTAYGTFVSNEGIDANASVSCSASSTYLVVDAVSWNQFNFPATESIGPQQTRIGISAAGAFTRCSMSWESGSASVAMTRGFNTSTNYAIAAIPLFPSAAGGGGGGSGAVAPVFAAQGTVENSTPGTAIAVPAPTGIVGGEVLFAMLAWATATETINAVPTNWTLIRTTTQGAANDISVATYYKICSAGDAGATFTWHMTGTGVQNNGVIWRITGAHATTPFDTSSGQGGTGAGVSAPSVTTAVNNELLCFFAGLRSDAAGLSLTPPTGYTQHQSLISSGICEQFGAEKAQAGAGAVGVVQATINNAAATNTWACQIVAFRPPDSSVEPVQCGMFTFPDEMTMFYPKRHPIVYCGHVNIDITPGALIPLPPTAWWNLDEQFFAHPFEEEFSFSWNDLPRPGDISTPQPPPNAVATQSIGPRVSLPPQQLSDEAQWQRQAALWMSEANQGHLQNTGIITLEANASQTVVNDDRVGAYSCIGFMPRTANAAAELRGGTMYFSVRKQSFVVFHANNAQDDRTFVYSIMG